MKVEQVTIFRVVWKTSVLCCREKECCRRSGW